MKEPSIPFNDDMKFLIYCCKTSLNKEEERYIQNYLLSLNDQNITTLLEKSNQHAIIPLVYKTLSNIESTPTSFLSKLKKYYMHTVQKNMMMSTELIRIMKLLEDNGIEALAFKGPTLAQLAYGNITLRQFVDLDILVNEKDLYHTAQLLVSQHYLPMDSIGFLKNTAKLHVEKNYEFYGKTNGIKVEIHWRLLNTFFLKKFKVYNLFETPTHQSINQRNIPTLDSHILLIYLSNHGASHMWERLAWIIDIDRLVESNNTSFEWNKIILLASSLQSKTTLLLGLGLANTLFNTTLPTHIKQQINTKHITTLITFVTQLHQTSMIEQDHTSYKKNLKVFQFNLALQSSFIRKVIFIFHTLFNYSDRDVMLVNLPKRLFFLYYPLRILRIINKYTVQLLKKRVFQRKSH
jgi:hypothetical protein